MKNLNTPRPQGGDASASRFEAANALAFLVVEADGELIEPELVAWIDRASSKAPPEVAGCPRPDGWHDYDLSHCGGVEVGVDRETSVIFAEASPFDSHEHFGHGPFINLRNMKGEAMICMSGGNNCVSLDE